MEQAITRECPGLALTVKYALPHLKQPGLLVYSASVGAYLPNPHVGA